MRNPLILSGIVLFMYACAFAAYVRIFLREHSGLARALRFFAPAAVALHIVFLALLCVKLKHLPITTPFESTSSLAMLIALVYIYIELRTKIRSTGALIFLFVFGLQLVSVVLMRLSPASPSLLGSPILNLHIVLALFSYTAFCLSFLYSILYLMLHEDIKSSNFGMIYEKLPSLEQLDDMNYRAAAAGTAVLAVAILIGFIWAWIAFGSLPLGDIKVLVTVGTCAVYSVIILMKLRFGWGGERIALLSAFGFLAVLVSLLFLNVFSQTFHSFF